MGTPPYTATRHRGRGLKCASNILNSSIAVPRNIAGCCTQQNIGEVARSDGGVEKVSHQPVYIGHLTPSPDGHSPLYRYAAQGERAKMRFEYFKLLHCRAP